MSVFVIAEAGVNHNGSLDIARELIDVAAKSGADAVKFQTFKADKVAVATAPPQRALFARRRLLHTAAPVRLVAASAASAPRTSSSTE